MRAAKNPYFWGAIVGVALVTLSRPLFRKEPQPPPVIGTLMDFAAVDQDGKRFGSDELKGSVWVASFFFTTCKTVCPALIQNLKGLEERYRSFKTPIHIVSISVDPTTDTPERLRTYLDQFGLRDKTDRWHFVTGDEAKIRELVTRGFMLAMGTKAKEGEGGDAIADIAHSQRLVLVDPTLGLRGVYDSTNAGLDEVFHRAQHVWMEAKKLGTLHTDD